MVRKPPKGKSLAEYKPEIAEEWHPTKNGDLTPDDVSYGTAIKVWWKCPKGDDHEWEAYVYSRSKGQGCSICAGQKVVKSNSLANLNAELAKQWHTSKNGDLTALDVSPGSNKKVWWQCSKGDDHEWEASPSNRKNGSGCPICSGKKVVNSNCLATLNPELAELWHPTKNGNLTANDISLSSNKKLWWKCPKESDHEWQKAPNGFTSNDSYCPMCSGQVIVKSNSLAKINPELAKLWHPTKNLPLTTLNISPNSHKKVWWVCPIGQDHIYESSVKNKNLRGDGCSVCAGKYVVDSTRLANKFPDIYKQWHPTKNKNVNAYNIYAFSSKHVWWKCSEADDHEWKTSVNQRTRLGTGCPFCDGQRVDNKHTLGYLKPKFLKDWHPTKNIGITPFDIGCHVNMKIWWLCNRCSSEWRSSPNNRSKGKGCPLCELTPQSKQELTVTFELIQFFEDINPKGFKTVVNGKRWTIDTYVPQLHLGIEFDGSYWHKDKRALDKLKTKQLQEEGFNIIRIREQDRITKLKKITKNDVISKTPFNGKEVTNNVLKQIMKMYELDAKKIAKIESYIAKKELQNEKGLDKYIDMILTEKAEKKK